MVLWIALAVLLALSLGALLWPLFSRNAPEGGGEDREVYAAQLEEMEADRARGLIGDADAAAARAEIARRLLRARDGSGAAGTRRRTAMVVALCVGVFVPAFSLGAYLFLGAPDYGDLPLAARTAPVTDEELERLLVRAEARLGEDPDDARGWMAVAPIYQRLGRFEDAANAFGRLNALAGDNAQWLSAQGESLTFASEGEVTDEAAAVFEKALALDPQALRPAIFLAIAARQKGEFIEAGERWRRLLARSDGTEPWLQIATAEFARMGGPAQSGTDASAIPGEATAVAPGETPAPPQAAGAVPGLGAPSTPAGEPPAMVIAMVERLAARLEAEGGSAEDWARLVRSYRVLGRDEDAKRTVEAGLAALSGDARAEFQNAPDVKEVMP